MMNLSQHGQFLSAQPDGSLQCNRDSIQGWETFELENIGEGGEIAIKTAHGHYVKSKGGKLFD
jgi:hypothetical protein